MTLSNLELLSKDSPMQASAQLDLKGALLHPAFGLSLVALVLNDHVLKHAGVLPNRFTGKLSDFAGLMVAPLVLAALVRARHRNVFHFCHVLVGLGFALINTSAFAAQLMVEAMGALRIHWKIWSDPSDLVALPMLWVSMRVLGKAAGREVAYRSLWGRSLARMGLVVGMLGCVGSSRMPPVRVAADKAHVYAPTSKEDGGLVFLDIRTGEQVRQADSAIASFPRPTVIDGTLIASSGAYFQDGGMLGIDTQTGRRVFQLHAKESSDSREILSASGAAIFVRRAPGGGSGTEMVAVHPRTGKVVWQKHIEDGDRAPLHARDDTLLYVDEQRLVRLSPLTGAVVWSIHLPDDAVSVTSMRGRAYVQLDTEVILVVDLERGTVVLRREIPAETYIGWTTASGSMTASRSSIFLDTPDGIMVLDEELRVRRMISGVFRPYAEGDMVVAQAQDFIYRLDSSSGVALWRYQVGFWTDAATLTQEVVVLGGDDEIVAIDGGSGTERWRWSYPHARD